MKIKEHLWKLPLTIAVILITTSCVPEFTNPLPPPANGKPDKTVLGVWETAPEENDRAQVSVFPRASGEIDVVYVANVEPDERLAVLVFEGYATRIGKDNFLCLRRREPDDQSSPDEQREVSYLILHYRMSAEGLRVTPFSNSALRRMIEQEELKGNIREQKYFNEITVTASSDELAAAVIREGVAAFIDKGFVLKYRRLCN